MLVNNRDIGTVHQHKEQGKSTYYMIHPSVTQSSNTQESIELNTSHTTLQMTSNWTTTSILHNSKVYIHTIYNVIYNGSYVGEYTNKCDAITIYTSSTNKDLIYKQIL